MMLVLLELSPELELGGEFCVFCRAAGSACAESGERGGGVFAGGDCPLAITDSAAAAAMKMPSFIGRIANMSLF